jgi:hypothetical protein
MCNFAILMPSSADPNDILNVTIVFLSNLDATLIKGTSLGTATNIYTVSAGQSFTARSGQNFYLNLVGNSGSFAQFVFTVAYVPIAGTGTSQPTTPTNIPVVPTPTPTTNTTVPTTN